MTYELRDAFDTANADDSVKVIILAGTDPHFSAGHDLQGDGPTPLADYRHSGTWAGFAEAGAEGLYAREREIYLDMCERFRAIGKPTIAEVQGRCAAGGLMLAWVCDLIVASDDASFVDPVVAIGVAGVEYFAHPFEFGVRKAKELLFTGDILGAADAHRLGMVNQVVPRAELTSYVLAMATRIAAMPSFALKMTKEAVNAAEDAMGRRQAMLTAFAIHQLCHAHNRQEFGAIIDPRGLAPSVQKQFVARLRGELDPTTFRQVCAKLGVDPDVE